VLLGLVSLFLLNFFAVSDTLFIVWVVPSATLVIPDFTNT